MSSFDLLDHTADLGIVGRGDSFAEALAGLAKGMFSVIADLEEVQLIETKLISVKGVDPESLVVNWLNELLYTFETEGFLPKDFQINVTGTQTSLNAQCMGEAADPDRHQIVPVVKGATYHGLEIAGNGEWQIRVVVDL